MFQIAHGSYVAPHVGAWIEITKRGWNSLDCSVAPHVGAWIEISEPIGEANLEPSHPTWVRGLKSKIVDKLALACSVAPHVGAWIEIFSRIVPKGEDRLSHPTWVRGLKFPQSDGVIYYGVSHPTWVRGLKFLYAVHHVSEELSHPTWVRGLKLLPLPVIDKHLHVAPHVGAWIEIRDTCGLM